MLNKKLFVLILLSCTCFVSCVKDEMPYKGAAQEDFAIRISSEGILDKFNVPTKGTDIKTPEEQEIKSLQVFIFDQYGNYLEASEQHRYQGYRNLPEGKTVLNIDRNGWLDENAAMHATIVAVANLETYALGESSDAETPPSKIKTLSDLENFIYLPTKDRLVTSLPDEGMPMYGIVRDVDLTSGNTSQSIDIPLKALMSRIDIRMSINSQHTDIDGRLPSLTITNYEVLNAPAGAAFTEMPQEETNILDEGSPRYVGEKNYSRQTEINTIYNHDGEFDMTFYVFENLQDRAVDNYSYPDSVDTDEERQRYKPELADTASSLAVRFTGNYITYNGASYKATYTLYLGGNCTDDFKVMRNKQYINNITIEGIVNVGNNPDHITFDARVDITESNPYFISMLKDRTMDSHFNVVPIDFYLFESGAFSDGEQTIDIEIVDPDVNDWLRMELVPSENMSAGTVADSDEQIATREPWHAGNGKRKYFYTDLVTDILKNNTAYTGLGHRDRVYLYVDENLDVWHLGTQEERTRKATLLITYKEGGQVEGTRTITVEQAKLLEVTFHPSEAESDFSGKSIYIEAYEEYRDHGDPLDEHATDLVYNGLPWEEYGNGQNKGAWITNSSGIECSSNFYWGHEFTEMIVENAEDNMLRNITLNDKTVTAAGYCYNKNKRNHDGTISNHKWYLPGIRELERILEDYYIEYKEFQQNYYWSSAAGENNGNNDFWDIGTALLYNQNRRKARATKAYIKSDNTFGYWKSGTSWTYTGENGQGGYADRTTVLRIRAARIDAQPQQ